jgi:hypothetical protein
MVFGGLEYHHFSLLQQKPFYKTDTLLDNYRNSWAMMFISCFNQGCRHLLVHRRKIRIALKAWLSLLTV